MMSDELKLSDFQKKVCAIPEQYDLFLGGGRGGAKSFTLAILALRHAEQYEGDSRILFIRKSYKGLADFETITRELFGKVYGTAASYNQTEHVWRLPNGAYFELGQLESPKDYQKYQGRSFNLLLCDEAGQYSSPQMLDKLRSNLRGPKNMPIRQVFAANPGGPGHHWLADRFVFNDAKPWQPFHEDQSKREFVYVPSTYRDNPFIDQEEYRRQLKASLPTDEELLKAWLNGDWSVARGAYFATVIEEKRNAIDPWENIPGNWKHWLAHDYGASAPSVTYILARSPGATGPDGNYYPAGSIFALDELSFARPNALNEGMGYTVPHQAELIKEFADQWGIRPYGCADDAIFSNHGSREGSIANEFRDEGVNWFRAKKGSRKSGWEKMRTMLQDAGKPDRKGLYVSRKCKYFWKTVPYLGRDERDPEDVDTDGADHAADAIRYGISYNPIQSKITKIRGL